MENSKQLYFEMPNNTALGIEDYIITDSNSFAFDLILRMIKNEIKLGIVSGPSFSGKTHLSKILIKNIGTDEHLYIDKDYKNIIEKVGSSNLIVIENIDKVIENKSEEDLFHIINFTKENDKKLLMTSSKSVSNIEFKLEDLKSRLSAIIHKYGEGNISTIPFGAKNMLESIRSHRKKIENFYETLEFSKAMKEIMICADIANQFIDSEAPWSVAKSDTKYAIEICTAGINACRYIMIYLKPVLPNIVEGVEALLNNAPYKWNDLDTTIQTQSIKTYHHLASRVTLEEVEHIINM